MPAPVVGKVSSPSTPSTDPSVRMNGLRLKVWPQLVDGLTGEVGNFSIRLASLSCDPEDSCEEAGDEVGGNKNLSRAPKYIQIYCSLHSSLKYSLRLVESI